MKDNEIKVGDLCVVSVGTKVLPFSNDEFSKTLSVYLGMLKHKKNHYELCYVLNLNNLRVGIYVRNYVVSLDNVPVNWTRKC
jgi:hypothetical protein